ncbi:MAG: glycoside hydrolase family 28 protein [bacterium]
MLNPLFVGSTSAFFELENDLAYYAPAPYRVLLNGTELFTTDKNTFSLYSLTPATQYTVSIENETGIQDRLHFETEAETCCISVKDFGAAGDGQTDDTKAIQSAINFTPAGGRLLFPAGTYLTTPLSLRSDFTMELAEGATILGSTDRGAWPVLPGESGGMVFGTFEGIDRPMYQALITAQYAKNIRIIGQGIIDAQAQNADWWTNFRNFTPMRPRLFFTNRCENITLHGVTFRNSPSWNLHPFFSKNIRILGVLIQAPKDSPNTDAIDPEACDGVDIIGCRFQVGDDCIAIKSGKIDMARRYRTPANHHTIRNCLMDYGHGAVVLGSENSGGIWNLSVTRCYFRGTDRGLRIKSRRGRGRYCLITNVLFDNIVMDGVLTPLVINMWYNCVDPDAHSEYVWSREKLPVDERTPHLGSFTFKNMVCTGAEVAACYMDGLPESPIDRVALENISISFKEDAKPGRPAMREFMEPCCKMGLYFDNVNEISLENVTLSGVVGEPLIAAHAEHIEAQHFEVI